MNIRKLRGFTLIELLVVIAIIAILASIILASLNSARIKSRDTRRVADVKELQNALELYNNSNGQYPPNLAALVPTYISVEPMDPQSTTTAYSYGPLAITASTATCSSYHLGATLEQTTNTALSSKAGMTISTATVANSHGLYLCTAVGASADFSGTPAAVYDLTP